MKKLFRIFLFSYKQHNEVIIIKYIEEKAAFAAIEEGVKRVNSSDSFKTYLRFLTKFHQYSLHNTLLILRQCPHATYVAGYQAWAKNFNRHVKKGEKAIKILAPLHSSKESDDGEEYIITNFKTVNVFDISQTEGDEIPLLVKGLSGNSVEASTLIETLKTVSKAPVIFTNPDLDITLMGGARGYYNALENLIVINENLDINQIAKTLSHEFAHSILHRNSDKKRAIKEIEAEALAFVICHYFKLDTGDYSFPYIASYAKQDSAMIKEILNDIQVVAHQVIEDLKPIYTAKSLLANNTNPNILTGNSSSS